MNEIKTNIYCKRCKRKLKSKASQEIGYGPTCYKKEFGNNTTIKIKKQKIGGQSLQKWLPKL